MGADIPMLGDDEWEPVLPPLLDGHEQIRRYRQRQGALLKEAKDEVHARGALARYEDVAGYHETNPDALWHHRLGLYGSLCNTCGKPFRTPRAKLCAACGAHAA